LIFRGNIQEKEINIHICPDKKKNHISIDLANQLIIPKTSVIETKDLFGNKYDIKDLPLTLEDYKLVSNFEVTTIYEKEVDIVLGSTWLETLGSLILNFEKKFLMFSYKKKKITLHDVSMNSDSVSTSKILIRSPKCYFRINNSQYLRSKKSDKFIIDKDAEISRLKNHNQSLVTLIKKLKNEKKSQKERLEQFYSKETMTSEETILEPIEIKKLPIKKIQTSEKGINTNLVNLTTHVKRSSNVEVETIQGYEEDSFPKINQEKDTSIRSKDQVARMPYRHPNHKSRYFGQSMYQITDMPKNITSTTSGAQSRSYHGSRNASSSFQEPYKSPNLQKIELGWANSFTIRQFCSALRRSYRLRSSTITNSRMKNHETIITIQSKR
jgi:hypothetical protein